MSVFAAIKSCTTQFPHTINISFNFDISKNQSSNHVRVVGSAGGKKSHSPTVRTPFVCGLRERDAKQQSASKSRVGFRYILTVFFQSIGIFKAISSPSLNLFRWHFPAKLHSIHTYAFLCVCCHLQAIIANDGRRSQSRAPHQDGLWWAHFWIDIRHLIPHGPCHILVPPPPTHTK